MLQGVELLSLVLCWDSSELPVHKRPVDLAGSTPTWDARLSAKHSDEAGRAIFAGFPFKAVTWVLLPIVLLQVLVDAGARFHAQNM